MFANWQEHTNSHVFGSHITGEDRVWFPAADWKGDIFIDCDTLSALSAADSVNESTERFLTYDAYGHAFDTWDVASKEVNEE